MKNFEIVLASYRESLSWLDYLPKKAKRKYNITVSNSGGITDVPSADRVINVPNGGREAGHYLNFIVENYDNLHPVTVFMQADPWPHAAGHITVLLAMLFGTPTFDSPICYLGQKYASRGLEPMVGSPIDKLLTELWSGTYPIGIPFSIGAQFYVTKETILRQPKEYYEKLSAVSRDSSFSFAHLVEGHWGNVFQHRL